MQAYQAVGRLPLRVKDDHLYDYSVAVFAGFTKSGEIHQSGN